ncbi:YfjI family protein [Streptomyces sp. SP18ES09]|nr:YfjI family protein [Streptomyces sp. SP18ES09]
MSAEATEDDLREALALGAATVPAAWPEPIPLDRQPKLPPFPVHALPGWVSDFVVALAEETQTPVDLAGALALSVLATAAGGRAVVQVRGRWREPTNLFVVVALGPANRKSAVFAAMTAPLYEAENTLVEGSNLTIVEAEVTARMAREAADKAAAQAAKAEGPERDNLVAEAIGLAQTAESLTVPPRPRLLADDATPETVTTLLAEQGGRLAVMSAEGGIFDIIAGRYSGVPNMEVFLKGHAGDRLRVDRRTRQEFIEAPALTMGLAVQPSVLEDIGKNRGFDGRGLLARFLYCLPESLVGYRKIDPDPVPPAVGATYERNVFALTLKLADWTDPLVVQVGPEADAALMAYGEHLEPQLRSKGGRLGHIGKWAGKLVGAAARIAGLLHLAEHIDGGTNTPISATTMGAAIELADYFAAHALTVFDLMGADAALARARSLLSVLEDNGWESVSRRDLFAKLSRSEFPTIAELEPAAAVLEEHGYLRSETPPRTGKRGRPPAPRYLIHPSVREPKA